MVRGSFSKLLENLTLQGLSREVNQISTEVFFCKESTVCIQLAGEGFAFETELVLVT